MDNPFNQHCFVNLKHVLMTPVLYQIWLKICVVVGKMTHIVDFGPGLLSDYDYKTLGFYFCLRILSKTWKVIAGHKGYQNVSSPKQKNYWFRYKG